MSRYAFDDPILKEMFDLPFEDYPVDEARTAMIDMSKPLGNGFQGSVYPLLGDSQKVAKLFRIKKDNLQKDSIIPTYYAAMIGVGPKVFGRPFVTPDRKNVVVIMEKVMPYKPTAEDVNKVIQLYEECIAHSFMTYDSEFAKTSAGKLVLLDFGVSFIYKSPRDALLAALSQDMFANTGIGYYHPDVEKHFAQKGARRRIYRN